MSAEEDSNEQDCTVYIQQLKSDTSSLKLNAATKLPLIASVLGHNRIRDELIPYLIEIIEQMDNDNEFLIKVAEGLVQLKQICRSIQDSYILIPPLKILASLDQPAVRERAVISLQKLAEGQSFNFFRKHFYPLVKDLAQPKGLFSPRVSACGLIPTCYPHLESDKQLQLNSMFKRLGLQEDSPMVRRALAENMQAFSKVTSKNYVRIEMFQIWQAFIADKIDIIRIKALEISPILAKFFKKEEIAQKFLKPIKIVDINKKAWRIRYSLAECLANMLPYLQKQIIKKDVVEVCEQLLKDTEAQVRCITLLKVPQIAQKISPQQSYNVFFQYYEKASTDTSLNVKLIVVEAIVPYFGSLEKQKMIENGIPIVQCLLKDENPTVRSGIIERLKNIHEVLGEQNTKKFLIPLLEGCLNDKKWRFKLAIAESIPSLFKTIGYANYKDFIDKVLNHFIKDHYSAVREQVIQCIVQLKPIFGPEKNFQIIQNLVKMLLGESNYVYRSTAWQLIGASVDCLDKKDFNELFIESCKKIENQNVNNVLIVFFSLYQKIKNSLNSQSKKQLQSLARKIREKKTDEDILYFISKTED